MSQKTVKRLRRYARKTGLDYWQQKALLKVYKFYNRFEREKVNKELNAVLGDGKSYGTL